MTDLIIQSSVMESTVSTGPGTLDLDGAASGWNRFRTFFADNDFLLYVRRNAAGNKQQLIRGQVKYGTGAGGRDQLTVGTVLKSSDGGASPTAIDFVAGDNPCAVFCTSPEDILDSVARTNYGTARPAWMKKGLWVDDGAGATARKLYWFDGTDDIELFTIDEAGNASSRATLLTLGAAINEAKGADIASAGTTDIGAATGNYLEVTGVTTITALGTIQAGTRRIVRFTGALTLTHNATSLILPGAANITTAAGDLATFVSLGSGNWRCVDYKRAAGTPLFNAGPLATLVASSSAQLDFTLVNSTLYAGYRVLFENILPATDNVSFEWLASIDGGSSFITTGTYANAASYANANPPVGGATITGTAPAIAQNLGNAAGRGLKGAMDIVSGGAVAYGTQFHSKVGHLNNGGGAHLTDAYGANSTATAVNAYRFRMSSGNIASGTIRVFGIPK